MPFNLLILPLLAGFILLAYSNLRSYSTSQLSKDQLLLHAALAGFILLVASRIFCLMLLATDAGQVVARQIHQFAPFPYIGTAIGTLVLSGVAILVSNSVVTEQIAGYWLYHSGRFDPLSRILWSSPVGANPRRTHGASVLIAVVAWGIAKKLWQALGLRILRTNLGVLIKAARSLRDEHGLEIAGLERGNPRELLLVFNDGKVMVCYVLDLLTSKPIVDFLTVVPIWTGFRDSKTNKLVKTTDYGEALKAAKDSSELSRAIRTSDIAWASAFSKFAFERHFSRKPSPRNALVKKRAAIKKRAPRRKKDAG